MGFFEQFDCEWGNFLGIRRDTFRQAFDYLAKKRASGHLIVETGCARQANNWAGDGQSSLLFGRFVSEFHGELYSVDIDPHACAFARSIAGPRTTVTAEDSVPYLRRLSRDLVVAGRQIDLLYLDSFDLDVQAPLPAAVHHLKEFCSIIPALGPGTLVMVDDSFRTLHALRTGVNSYHVIRDAGIGGKGWCVAEYFQHLGVAPLFEGYQCGWVFPDFQSTEQKKGYGNAKDSV
jgi:hypothetical protein